MNERGTTVSEAAMRAEWEEIRAAQTDPAAFQPLYDRYYEPIFRYLYRRCADEAVAADLCAQTFLKSLQKLGSYTFRGVPFSAWLYRIASNELNQHYRAAKKTRTVTLEDGQVDAMLTDLESVAEDGMRESMILALQDLRPNELELIELRFFEQRPFKEIAKLVNLTEANTKVKTYRVLERLRKHTLRRHATRHSPRDRT